MIDLVVVGGDLYVVEHLVVSNEIANYKDFYMVVDMDLNSYVVSKMIKGIDVSINVKFDVAGVDSLVVGLVLDRST
ncbi:hypothetical protein [Enterobacter hormaechei]|uniref:hypothetical protein n=1 Tax=Enterobacter hormaechei TaxID=158836 RepID=UPI0023E3E981|nr:hypothetical protein [Enterobacter hormaechei]MDF3675427.1 hypothetical protein [Enterobacter hormaechei]